MKTFPPDPLSTEERELAAMLARLAPHGVPSPEIDARILSASHGSVAGPRARSVRPRWPVAIGLAASMVLAVGVAWQLRLLDPAAGDRGPAAAEAWSAEELPAATPAPVSGMPDASPAVMVDAPPDAGASSAEMDSAAPRPGPTIAAPAPKAPAEARLERETEPAAAIAPPQKSLAPPMPAPAYAPPAAPAPAGVPSGRVQSKSLDAFGVRQQEAIREAEASSARDSGAAAEASMATRRELRVAPISERVQGGASASEVHSMRARRTDLQVPVAADAQLQVGDWLERVRTRYGLGDEEAARRSLLLFVQDHPTEPVPGDLEPLLDK